MDNFKFGELNIIISDDIECLGMISRSIVNNMSNCEYKKSCKGTPTNLFVLFPSTGSNAPLVHIISNLSEWVDSGIFNSIINNIPENIMLLVLAKENEFNLLDKLKMFNPNIFTIGSSTIFRNILSKYDANYNDQYIPCALYIYNDGIPKPIAFVDEYCVTWK